MKLASDAANIIARLAEANRYTQMYLDKRYQPYGISGYQHVYITIIYRNPGISQKELMDYLTLNPSNITRNIIQLEKTGYVKRIRDERDARVWKLYPTDKTEQYYDEIVAIFDGWREEILGDFTEEEKDNLSNYLARIKNNLLIADEK